MSYSINFIRARKPLAVWLMIILLIAQATSASAQHRANAGRASGKVILASFDGLAYKIWSSDPATRELRMMRRMAAEGVVAKGMIQAFPSVTPAGHAALWTGAYGNVSGIVAASNPILPRREHSLFDRESGFNGSLLQAEPLWVTAARQGINVVAHQATQDYPFVPVVTGALAQNAPVLISGYGPRVLEPNAVIRPDKVSQEDAGIWKPALPPSAMPVKAFSWKAQNVKFYGALVAEKSKVRGYTAIYIAADPAGSRVRVGFAPTENLPPKGRPLARHFSDGLHLITGGLHTVGYFRLFELSRDGSDFLLFQTSLHELALYNGKAGSNAELEAMLKEVGGFIGNGPSYQYDDGLLGKQLYAGGDGTAERRYLEGMELLIRQSNRHTLWVWKRYAPQFLMDYSPYPDEMEHTWYGLARPEVTGIDTKVARKILTYRQWGYAAIDIRAGLLNALAGATGHVIFVSDHGMSPVAKEVNVNMALQQAGLLSFDSTGRIDAAHTRAVNNKYGIWVNTKDWRGGIVALEERQSLVNQVEQILSKIQDPDTNQPIFTAFFRPEEYGAKFGIGGQAGADLYFELAPGYATSERRSNQIVSKKKAPAGEHGYVPTREEMLASFIARGPKLPRGATIQTIRSIDVASLVSDLLGIAPPAQNQGKSPFPKLQQTAARSK
jgi:predicted AlkP superfamily pyrophosphatase or phosphodiesterase